MSGEERRGGARFLSEFSVELRPAKGGELIDDRAIAHDISVKGFKVETQAVLEKGAEVSFALELPGGARAVGRGRVVWSARETFATWAGIKILAMSWRDKRRLSLVLYPDTVDWERLSSSGFKFVMAMTVIIAAHRILTNAHLRAVFVELLPKIVALTVMGWAFLGMVKREKQ